MYGEVIEKPAPRSCVVQTTMGRVCRNHRQIRKAKLEVTNPYLGTVHDDVMSEFSASLDSESQVPVMADVPNPETTSPSTAEPLNSEDVSPEREEQTYKPLRRSTRTRRKPIRFNDYSTVLEYYGKPFRPKRVSSCKKDIESQKYYRERRKTNRVSHFRK